MALGKKYRVPLKGKRIFKKVYSGALFNLAVAKNPSQNRFAFVAGTKISKKATERNKIKRQLFQIIWETREEFKPGDYIFYAKKNILGKNKEEIKEELKNFHEKNFKRGSL